MVHNCSGCVVDCRRPCCQHRYLTACGDCCPWLPLSGLLCELIYFYYRLYALCCLFLIIAVFNNHRNVLTAISTCERSSSHHLLKQVNCKRSCISLKKGDVEKIITKGYMLPPLWFEIFYPLHQPWMKNCIHTCSLSCNNVINSCFGNIWILLIVPNLWFLD